MRREKFAMAARMFLSATVGMAFMFPAVVGYFDYILVNDVASGTPKMLSEIQEPIERFSDTVDVIRRGDLM